MTLFPGSRLLAGPKHSMKVPFKAAVAVPLSVDEKEVALVPNPVPGLAVKTSLGPQVEEEEFDVCVREQSLFPFTLQMVYPFLSPPTVHLKVKVSPGQVGGGAANCPVTSPESEHKTLTYVLLLSMKAGEWSSSDSPHSHVFDIMPWQQLNTSFVLF